MMGMLFSIGRGFLPESCIETMLLTEENLRDKFPYTMADASGLVLFDCAFEGCPAPKLESNAILEPSFNGMYLQAVRMGHVLRCLSGDPYGALPAIASLADISAVRTD